MDATAKNFSGLGKGIDLRKERMIWKNSQLLSVLLILLSFFIFIQWISCVKPPPLQLSSILSDHAVLQRAVAIPLSGTTTGDTPIRVEIQNQISIVYPQGGKWSVVINPLSVGGPFLMTIHQGEFLLKFRDLWVGDLWFCGGQSNMRMPLEATENSQDEIAGSTDLLLRFLDVPVEVSSTPQLKLSAVHWQSANQRSVGNFSAVCYYFGKQLRKHLKIPIGLIHASRNASFAEAWVSCSALEAHPDLKIILDGPIPSDPMHDHRRPCGHYNAMISPLLSYPIRGATWYQGESNTDQPQLYQTLFPVLISSWRKSWGLGDFPFLFVQLAPFMQISSEPQESAWAELREAQLLTHQRCKNTAMTVITDAGDENDIHPKQKEIVGLRLALAAQAIAYGPPVIYLGPVFEKMEIQKSNAILSFKHIGSGIASRDGPLRGFTMAGSDGKFYPAQATIENNQVIVQSAFVTAPFAVRYGWANYPVGNLFNQEGLPASPFRTDRPDLSPRLTGCQPSL